MWFPKLRTKTREWKQPLNRITSDHIWASAAQSVRGRKETMFQLEEENHVTIVWFWKESAALSWLLLLGLNGSWGNKHTHWQTQTYTQTDEKCCFVFPRSARWGSQPSSAECCGSGGWSRSPQHCFSFQDKRYSYWVLCRSQTGQTQDSAKIQPTL